MEMSPAAQEFKQLEQERKAEKAADQAASQNGVTNPNREEPEIADNGRPVIWHDPTDITTAVNQTLQAMMQAGVPLWQRDGMIVSIQSAPREPSHGLLADSDRLRIVPVKLAHIQELATASANHMLPTRFINEKQYFKPGFCYMPTIHAIDGRMRLPLDVLSAASITPTLRADGSLIEEEGYDKTTGIFYQPYTTFPPIPQQPTADDVQQALAQLQEPFVDFTFAQPFHKSAAIAAVLTVPVRHLLDNVPLVAVTSETRAAGKGLTVDTISMIGTGTRPALSGYARDDIEMEKQLLILAMNADQVVSFDNVVGTFGGPSLDRVLTGQMIRGRILGQSKNVEVKLAATFFATGNAIKYKGDTARRVLPIVLQSEFENPEERTGFKYPHLRAWVAQQQPQLLIAALTILRAYILTGMPSQSLSPYGSFEMWSDLIRSAVVWCGLDDPCQGRKELEHDADTNREDLATLLHAWKSAYGVGDKRTLKNIVDAIKHEADDKQPTLSESPNLLALGDAFLTFDVRANDKIADINPRRLGKRLPFNSGRTRIIDDHFLTYEKDKHANANFYWIERAEKIEVKQPQAKTLTN